MFSHYIMTVTKTTVNLPWTVCPGAPGFSPAAQNWSEKTKHSDLKSRKLQLNYSSKHVNQSICYLL